MNLNQNITDLDGKNESWFLGKKLNFWPQCLGHYFVLSENCFSQKRVKNKVRFFVYKSANFGPTDKIWIFLKFLWNFWSEEPIRSHKFEKNTNVQRNFLLKRAPQNMVNCGFRRHLLSEMHNFRAIWLVSSRLLEHCQF